MRTQLLKHSMSLQEFLCLCPRFSGQHHYKLVEYRQEGLLCRFIPKVMQGSGWQQRLHVVEKARSRSFANIRCSASARGIFTLALFR